MATSSNYYIDTATFATATAVFMNQGLSVLAPDGIYSFGSTTRQQSGGVLLAAVACPACGTPCGGAISGSGGTGIYKITLDVGSLATGAIVISFDPAGVPDGIRATYNGVVYNKISSPANGVRQGTPGHFTTIGTTGADCGLNGNTTTGNYTVFNYVGTSFVNSGTTQANTLVPGDVFLGATFGNTKLVIPKPTANPSVVDIEIIGPCSGTGWNFAAICPTALSSFMGSVLFATASISCATAMAQTYYFVKVHTASDTFVGLYDYVFTDVNGQFPLANGFYLISNVAVPNKVIQVDNGVVIAITNCI
jgi:hypothetical protein